MNIQRATLLIRKDRAADNFEFCVEARGQVTLSIAARQADSAMPLFNECPFMGSVSAIQRMTLSRKANTDARFSASVIALQKILCYYPPTCKSSGGEVHRA